MNLIRQADKYHQEIVWTYDKRQQKKLYNDEFKRIKKKLLKKEKLDNYDLYLIVAISNRAKIEDEDWTLIEDSMENKLIYFTKLLIKKIPDYIFEDQFAKFALLQEKVQIKIAAKKSKPKEVERMKI